MLRHYLKHGFRALLRQRSYALINLLGLGTGIASFILILLYLQHELSFDRHIPALHDTYRLVEIQRPPGIDVQHVAITAGPWARELKENIPGVQNTLRMMGAGNSIIRIDDKVLRQGHAYFADGSIISMWNIELREGHPELCLSEPNTAVLSRSTALRFYGTDQDIPGREFRLGEVPFVVSGLMEDYHYNTHLRFEMLLSYPTAEQLYPDLQRFGANYLSTFVQLQPGVSRMQAEETMRMMIDSQMNEMGLEDAPRPDMYLQPLSEVYLKSGHIKYAMASHSGDIRLIWIFSAVALLILLIACINFINLSTARSSRRALEVGLRKVMGAQPSRLMIQFLGESVMLTFVAIILALGLVELFLPEFNALLGTSLRVDLSGNWIFNIGLLALLGVVGFLAGIYPALYLSRFQPTRVLKASSEGAGSATGRLRRVLVVFQFFIASILVFSTLVIQRQWNYMNRKDKGIDVEEVVSLRIWQNQTDNEVFRQLKASLLTLPGVMGASAASGPNGVSGSQGDVTAIDSVDVPLMVRFGFVDEDFFPMMGIRFLEGQNFERDRGSDMPHQVILNRAAADALGWTGAVGRRFRSYEEIEVVGVIDNYHYYSVRQVVEPAFYLSQPERYSHLLIRFEPGMREQRMADVENIWKIFFHDLPFEPAEASAMISRQYAAEADLMRIIRFFAMLCIIISALGLFGLSAFVAEQKKREIGIRKVLGSSTPGVIIHLQKEFLKLVGLALVLGSPVAWLIMNRWLSQYAHRISPGLMELSFSWLLVLVIAFLTILYHAWRAASANPVDAMKTE